MLTGSDWIISGESLNNLQGADKLTSFSFAYRLQKLSLLRAIELERLVALVSQDCDLSTVRQVFAIYFDYAIVDFASCD